MSLKNFGRWWGILHMHIEDRMIARARHLQTPLPRLQELAPRLLGMLPNTIGACTERLSATRQEIEDTAEFLLDQVADRGGWTYIEPIFGDLSPSIITLEMLDGWYARLVQKKGIGEAGRAMKIWRALYNVMAAMKLCPVGQDPSLAIRKTAVPGRTETSTEGEAVRLVKTAWREGYHGLACIIAVAWDTSFSPIDVRTLTPDHAVLIGNDWGFAIRRGKTNEAAYGILSRRTRRLVETYLNQLDYELHDSAPMFRTKGHVPTEKGGRPRIGVPYEKNTLATDFRTIRTIVFGKDETRRLMDMRRTGAVEANAGGAPVEHIAAKMGNSIDQNKTLQKTYMPVSTAAVRSAEEARRIGRKKLESEQNEIKKLKLVG